MRVSEQTSDPAGRPGDAQAAPVAAAQVDAAEPSEARNETAAGARRSRRARKPSVLRETAIIVVAALVLSWLIKTFLVQAFYIPSASMEDTLVEGDRVMVSRLVPSHLDLHRGDVIVFTDPGSWLEPQQQADHGPVGNAVVGALTFVGLRPNDSVGHLIKRVIGMPGDHVACAGPGEPVTVNGVALDEPYLKPGSEPSQVEFSTTVPDGMLFVMGDNRQDSSDSRFNTGKPGGGFVPEDDVVGVAFVKVWPLSHAGLMRNPGDTFRDVPAP